MQLLIRNQLVRLVILGGTALSCGWADSIQYSFTELDFPGADATFATGINNNGVVVGSYREGQSTHGFIYSNGVFTTFDAPSGDTMPYGINDNGEIVGTSSAGGFLYDNGTFTSILGTPKGINDSGDIVGDLSNGQGYEIVGSLIVPIIAPGYASTSVSGINNNGQIVGTVSGPGNGTGFLQNAGVFDFFGVGALDTEANGISDNGVIAGHYSDGGPGHSYTDSGGVAQKFSYPNSSIDGINGINDSGVIVGTAGPFVETDVGFIGTPIPEPSLVWLALLGLGFIGCGRLLQARNR